VTIFYLVSLTFSISAFITSSSLMASGSLTRRIPFILGVNLIIRSANPVRNLFDSFTDLAIDAKSCKVIRMCFLSASLRAGRSFER